MSQIHPSSPKTIRAQKTLYLAAGILLLAAIMRLGLIASLPPGMDNDEAFHMLRAEEIARGEALPVYITGNNGNEPLYAYTAAIGFALVGPTAWAGRLMAAFVGLLGVAITIRLGKEMFPRRHVGLFAGLVLSTLLWHVEFSRFGSQPILAATAAVGTIAALWRGARTGARRYYVLAGACLSLGLDAYVAFRLFLPVPIIAGLALFVAAPRNRRSVLWGGLAAAGAALVVYSPLALFFIQNPQWFFNRFGQTTEGMLNASSVLLNVVKTFGGLVWQGDPDYRFNIPGRPALDVAQAAFFIIGAVVLLRRWRKPESWALAAWLVLGLAPSMVTVQAPHFGRTTTAISAVVIIAALGMATVWELVRPRALHILMAGMVLVPALVPVWLYFGVWAQDPRAYQSYDVQQAEIARQLKAAPAGAALYATPLHVGWLHDYWTTEYLLGRDALARYSPFNGTLCTVAPAVAPNGARFAVVAAPEADDWRTPDILQRIYPDIRRTPVSIPGERFDMIVYDLPPGAVAGVNLAPVADFGNAVRLLDSAYSPLVLTPGKPLRVDVTWQTLSRTEVPFKLFVHLLGPKKPDGSTVYAQFDGEPCALLWHTTEWRPGELLFDTYTLRVPKDLPPGPYALELGWYNESTGARLTLPGTAAASFTLANFQVK